MAAAAGLKHITNQESATSLIKELDTTVKSGQFDKVWTIISRKDSGISEVYITELTKKMQPPLSQQQAENLVKSLHAKFWQETGVKISLQTVSDSDEAKKKPQFF